jgi:hypothetical protein
MDSRLEESMKLALLISLPLLLGATLVHAQRPASENIDASKLSESGPAVVGGTGATAGPNFRNQAMDPMPGSQEEALSVRRPDKVGPSPPRPLPKPGGPVRITPVMPAR